MGIYGSSGLLSEPFWMVIFGFLQRGTDILCIAATDGGDFYTSRIPRLSLEQALSRRMQTTNLHTSEPLLMSVLDLAAVDP